MIRDISILIADDHPLYIEGLANMLNSYNYNSVICAGNGLEALEKARQCKPDIILMDANMPEMDGITALKIIKQELPEIKVIVLTATDNDQLLLNAIKAGASGFLLKNLNGETLHKYLQDLVAGQNPFSPGKQEKILKEFINMNAKLSHDKSKILLSSKQKSILEYISKGLTYKEIGTKLYISEPTVKYHIKEIKSKCGFNTQAQLLEFYFSNYQ